MAADGGKEVATSASEWIGRLGQRVDWGGSSGGHSLALVATGAELRLVECEGQPGTARVTTTLPLQSRQATDAMGRATAGSTLTPLSGDIPLRPWAIQQFTLLK